MNTIHAFLNAAVLTGFFAVAAAATPTEEATPATAKSWTHTGSVGIAVPVSRFNADGKDVTTVGVGMDFNYIGIARNGFTAELSVAGGFSSTDDIKFEEGDIQDGRFTTLDLGLGYTFNVGKNFSVSVIGTVGYEIAYFESEKKEYEHENLGKVDRTFSEALGALTLGGDVIVYKGLSEKAGIYVNVSGRWFAKSVTTSTVSYEKGDDTRTDTHTDDDNSGKYSVVPSVGVMYSF